MPRKLVADHLVYFDYDSVTGSWVLRDFMSGLRLDNHNSLLKIAEIEADANHDEPPPWCNAENVDDWRICLTLRCTVEFQHPRMLYGSAESGVGELDGSLAGLGSGVFRTCTELKTEQEVDGARWIAEVP